MRRLQLCLAVLTLTVSLSAVCFAAGPDLVTLKDGSFIRGEVLEMSNGELHIKTDFGVGEIIKVKWANVAKLSVTHPVPFHLKDGTVLVATAQEGDNGALQMKAAPMTGTMTVPMEQIASVNPMVQPPVVYSGNLTAGLSQTTGNSHLRNASILGEFVGRSEQLRLSLLGRYVYGDNAGALITRNSRGTIKLDFFLTKRLFWFASAYFEQDTFQDLKMRTALASGPGYQFIEKGDFVHPWFKDMTLYAEAGASYFNEDFKVAGDKSTLRGRWSIKFNWPILDDRITFYHFQEGYPSLQNTKDFYLTMDNGVRFKLWEGLVSGLQVTTRYNNTPPPGTGDTDNLYLMTFGYSFDTSRKR